MRTFRVILKVLVTDISAHILSLSRNELAKISMSFLKIRAIAGDMWIAIKFSVVSRSVVIKPCGLLHMSTKLQVVNAKQL